jgi:hypothetical protein
MGYARRSVITGIGVASAGILALSLVAVPPEVHAPRAERQAVQLTAFTLPTAASPRGFLVRTVGGQLKLLSPVDLNEQPTSLPAQQKRVTGGSVDDTVTSSTMTDGVVAAAVGPVADPFEPIWTALNSILAPVYAVGVVLFFVVAIPVAYLRFEFLSFLESVGLGALADFLAGIPAPPPALPVAFAATTEVDTTLAPMLKSAPLMSDPVPATAIAESTPTNEDNEADLSKQVTSLQSSGDTVVDAEADKVSIDADTETVERSDDSIVVAEAAELEEDTTIDLSEAAEAEQHSTDDVDSTGDLTELAETGKESPETPAAAGSEPTGGSAVASSPASTADGEASDGDSSDGSTDGS